MKHVNWMGLVALWALATAGCASDPAPLAPSEPECLEAIAEQRAMDGCGVFVRARRLGDEGKLGTGTMADPLLSLPRAIELARGGRRRVFVCRVGFYPDTLILPSGVDLLGAFDCDNGWVFSPPESIVAFWETSPPGPITLSIVPDDGDRQGIEDDGVSTVANIMVEAASTGHDGESLIAILVHPNTALELFRSTIRIFNTAGHGADGGEGIPDRPGRAPDGMAGSPGGEACSADTVPGGAAVTAVHEDGSMSVGGKGGDGRADRGDDGNDGAPLPSPNPSGLGLGGAGATSLRPCENGQNGAVGMDGADGRGGRRAGTFTMTGWVGEAGTEGADGKPGTGAGGGGGARGGTLACSAPPNGGRSGGSGGGGGWGGKGGKGGGHGGASVGVLAFDARVTLRDVLITTHGGGRGGLGQTGQDGGDGGQPGRAANAPGEDDALRACDGGHGGRGGRGGRGGGGAGGPSIGIAYVNEELLTVERVRFSLGHPGKGGYTVGPEGTPVAVGEDGFASETYRFTP
ncbi:hypothetical protein WME91_06180 [Sorangium sp. So ce269]